MRHVAVLALTACGRIGFDPSDPSVPIDASTDARVCPAAILCDDFEGANPWTLVVDATGSMTVTPGCGTAGSRCAVSIAGESTAIQSQGRFHYAAPTSATAVRFDGDVTIREATGPFAQVIAIDATTAGGSSLYQVGLAIQPTGWVLYQFVFGTGNSSESGPFLPLTLDQPLRLGVAFDFTANQAEAYVGGSLAISTTLIGGPFITDGIRLVLGLFVVDAGAWRVDFDDIQAGTP